ncbi:trypsin-like peptidase domain-containing protein [Candidatus Woesearchaeota archaeon]|nr:trypsin-like peptidase domain-containing protein [Candidatus Woesearchaeota archaeon]
MKEKQTRFDQDIKEKEYSLYQSFVMFRKVTIVFIVILMISLLVAGYYLYLLNKQMQQNYQALSTTITATAQDLTIQLTDKINTVDEKLTTELNDTKKEQEKKYLELSTDISTSQKESEKKIFTLQGKLQEVQNKSDEEVIKLKQSISSIQVQNKDFSSIIEDVVKTVVSLKTNKGIGSGVIISEKGYLVTNYHVIEGISALGIFTSDGKIYAGRLIGSNENEDIAVLQIVTNEGKAFENKEFDFLKFEDSDEIKVGQTVIAVGNPSGLEFSVSEGIISSIDRKDDNGTPLFQIDAAINPGNSGGPLVTINKKIAGINTLKLGGTEALGFAIKANVVDKFATKAIKDYEEKMM